MMQLTWLRTAHSGDWCLRSALRTLSGACQKWWWWVCKLSRYITIPQGELSLPLEPSIFWGQVLYWVPAAWLGLRQCMFRLHLCRVVGNTDSIWQVMLCSCEMGSIRRYRQSVYIFSTLCSKTGAQISCFLTLCCCLDLTVRSYLE